MGLVNTCEPSLIYEPSRKRALDFLQNHAILTKFWKISSFEFRICLYLYILYNSEEEIRCVFDDN